MVAQVTELLAGRRDVFDLTLGAGGHAEALLEAGVEHLVGFDQDPDAIATASERLARFGPRFEAVRARFSGMPVENRVDGVLFDLGVSSMQLDRPERGFSYRQTGPLDMRMGPDGETAMDIVNSAPEEELARIVFEYGEEHRSRRVAAAIVRARSRAPIATTDELARIVAGALGARRGGPHPARKTFQALRIAVNRELEELAASLPRAASILAPEGRLVVISYHSLEDRITKRALLADPTLEVLTKKPVTPSKSEAARNPRSRSAKLRAAQKLTEEAA
jgi:16S rRNA (cytosine1402-N4)-methyltransferase